MNRGSDYQQCARCILDTKDDPAITFDANGVCSYCLFYEKLEAQLKRGEEAEKELEQIVQKIKDAGAGKPYDCILGLSGGVDSTYLAYISKKLGLRPLGVHFDNGWNSELAVSNIEKIVTTLDIPFHTFVVDWDEFKDLQLSMLKASVVDIEMITDHAIITKLYDLALQHNIKYILSGNNVVTESILPACWIHNKKDHVNIQNIHKRFGEKPIRTFPLFDYSRKLRVAWRGIESITLLDYMPYEKKKVKKFITEKLGWRDYGGKHYESIFTRFYQGYILPHKFGIDKRRAHLSNLICSGQLSREEALAELAQPAYPEEYFKQDYDFVLKKLNLSDQEFQRIMREPIHPHAYYGVETYFFEHSPVAKLIVRPVWRWLKRWKNGL
jgi:N-acetyl sugar amidotransferase